MNCLRNGRAGSSPEGSPRYLGDGLGNGLPDCRPDNLSDNSPDGPGDGGVEIAESDLAQELSST